MRRAPEPPPAAPRSAAVDVADGHVLVVPREHYGDVTQLASGDPLLLAHLVSLAEIVASQEAAGQFRLIFNTGPQAGQSVFHVHGHVLAGPEPLGWSPA